MAPAEEMQYQLIIRADGSATMGLGHLVRSIALAEMAASAMSVSFICREIPDNIASDIKKRGFKVHRIDSEAEFIRLISPGDVVLLDGYHFTAADHWRIKTRGAMLAVIDDLYQQPLLADMVVNQSPGASSAHYKAPPHTRWALGPDYALLRPAFLRLAQRNRPIHWPPKKVMVTFGGADPQKLTEKCALLLIQDHRFERIALVMGAAYGDAQPLIQLADKDPRVALLYRLDEADMCRQMAESDLIIVPASGVLIEALSAGAQIVCGHYADNQIKLHQQFKRLNAFIDAGDFSDAALSKAIAQAGKRPLSPVKLIDGKSGERLSRLFQELAQAAYLKWQRAGGEHLDITYRWASDPRMRAFSFNNQPITYEEHRQWFEKKITDANGLYLIAYWNEHPLGSIRFDIREETAIISYQVDPAYQGRGFGVSILAEGIRQLLMVLPNISQLSGRIMPENKASIAAFRRLGFVPTAGTDAWTLAVNRPIDISSPG